VDADESDSEDDLSFPFTIGTVTADDVNSIDKDSDAESDHHTLLVNTLNIDEKAC